MKKDWTLERALVKRGLAQENTEGLRRLVKYINDGNPLLMDGNVEERMDGERYG